MYLRLDDGFAEHPKIVGLSDPAFRFHVSGLLYCSRNLTDGIVPANVLPMIRRVYRRPLGELQDRLLWTALDGGKWWEIHDYLDWNWSREQVATRREINRRNARERWQQ
jgi:hypothetical protein